MRGRSIQTRTQRAFCCTTCTNHQGLRPGDARVRRGEPSEGQDREPSAHRSTSGRRSITSPPRIGWGAGADWISHATHQPAASSYRAHEVDLWVEGDWGKGAGSGRCARALSPGLYRQNSGSKSPALSIFEDKNTCPFPEVAPSTPLRKPYKSQERYKEGIDRQG